MPELLAPAGGLDALLAAVAAGADAVYVGLGAYSARQASEGLSVGELARAGALAHAHGVRLYVTLNALVVEDEFQAALELARRAVAAGADALIVADVGLLRALARELPQAELHLSTQAGAASAEAAALAARELGCSRVTMARELSVDELARACSAGVAVEAFCHGAICICYSGACAFSALRRGRSANRGDCTQPCRLEYSLVDGEGVALAGGPEGLGCGGDRLLCPRDHVAMAHVAELAAAGVAALKIEGRMKNPDYAYNVVRCYREALDAVAAGRAPDAEGLGQRLALSFNRGFSDAYLRGARGPALGADLMSFERACNQGAYAGRLVEQRRDEVRIALARDVCAGDVLEIRSTPGEHAFPGVPKRWPMVPAPAAGRAGELLWVHCKRRVEPGSAVHVVRSAAVLAGTEVAVTALRAEFADLAAAAAGRPGEPDAEAAAPAAAPAPSAAPAPAPATSQPPAPQAAVATPAPPRLASLYLASSPDEARAVLAEGAAEVGVCAWRLEEPGGAWDALLPELTLVLDEVCRPGDAERALGLRAGAGVQAARKVVCRNLGQVDAVRASGLVWEAAAPINVWNAEGARWLAGLGAGRIWLSEELSDEAVDALLHAAGGAVRFGRIVGPRRQLMVTEHCALTAEGPCDGPCLSCPRRAAASAGDRFLVGADGVRLPVEVDAGGRTRIFEQPLIGACHR